MSCIITLKNPALMQFPHISCIIWFNFGFPSSKKFSSSSKPKAQMSFLIAICPLLVFIIVSFVIVNFSHFHLLSRNSGPISTKLGTKQLWLKRIQVSSNKGPRLIPRGDNWGISNIHWQNFFRTTLSILMNLSTKQPYVKGIQVYTNEGPGPFPRGDDNEIV